MPFPVGDDADPYKAMIHPERRRILHAIAKRPMTPNELIKELGLDQSLLSRHLHCLRDSNLVVVSKRDRSTEYTPNVESIDTLLEQILMMKPVNQK